MASKSSSTLLGAATGLAGAGEGDGEASFIETSPSVAALAFLFFCLTALGVGSGVEASDWVLLDDIQYMLCYFCSPQAQLTGSSCSFSVRLRFRLTILSRSRILRMKLHIISLLLPYQDRVAHPLFSNFSSSTSASSQTLVVPFVLPFCCSLLEIEKFQIAVNEKLILSARAR
jgi:hypothetical protein